MAFIKVGRVGARSVGDMVCEVDDDQYPVGSIVPREDYRPEDQEWHEIVDMGGHAHVGWIKIDDGRKINGPWDTMIWIHVEEPGDVY